MSQENVEIVRKTFDAIAAGDRDRALSYTDSAMVVDATRRVFNPGTYSGLEGLRQMLADMDDVWKELRPEAHEFLDAGDRVVVTGRLVAVGKGSGAKVESDFAGVWTVRDGRIARWDICADRAEALRAVGLTE